MAYFKYQDKSVFYKENGQGEPLIFLHGNTASSKMSELLMPLYADSFDGRTLNENFSENLIAERKAAKADTQAKQFYEWCQGADWEKVVDLDTEALLKCAEKKLPLFHKPLQELKIPVLFMGSRADESCRNNLEEEYKEMAAVLPQSCIHLFPCGGHPAIFTNAEKAAALIKDFISQHVMQ